MDCSARHTVLLAANRAHERLHESAHLDPSRATLGLAVNTGRVAAFGKLQALPLVPLVILPREQTPDFPLLEQRTAPFIALNLGTVHLDIERDRSLDGFDQTQVAKDVETVPQDDTCTDR